MLTPFRPDAKSDWEVIYEIIAAVCTSFQGLCVAMLFCFCNGEVILVIQKRLKDTCLWRKCASARGGTGRSALKSQRNRSNTFAFGSESLMGTTEATNCRQQHHFGSNSCGNGGNGGDTTTQTTPLPSSTSGSGNGARQTTTGAAAIAVTQPPPRRHLNGSNGSSVLTNVTVSSAESCQSQDSLRQRSTFQQVELPFKQQISLDEDEDSKSNSETIGLLQRNNNLPTVATPTAALDEPRRDTASPRELSSAA